MSLSKHPITYYFNNRFVITEDRAYFLPYRWELSWPAIRDILGDIFDLEDPKVYKDVKGRFYEGKVIVGHYFPKTDHIMIIFPEERSDYVEQRIKEVFGQ